MGEKFEAWTAVVQSCCWGLTRVVFPPAARGGGWQVEAQPIDTVAATRTIDPSLRNAIARHFLGAMAGRAFRLVV